MTQQELHELFHYDDGNLIWKMDRGNRKLKGTILGSHNKQDGYIKAKINGKCFRVHRLVWTWHHGHTDDIIDHRNNIRHDNRIENLRRCNLCENAWNVGIKRTSSTGFKGVYWCKKRNKFCARAQVNNARIHLGYRDTAEEAHQLYIDYVTPLHGVFLNSV